MIELLRRAVVVPVLTIDRIAHAVPLAKALRAGGLSVLEITLRTPVALETITRINQEVEGVVVGAGTVLNPTDLDRARDAGARFAVSPGLTPELLETEEFPILPGVATASEVMLGLAAGLTCFKFFPAVPAGGAPMLAAWGGPFPQARFCPTGGIDQGNASAFLALPNVVCVGGAWVAPKRLIESEQWDQISALARMAVALGGVGGEIDSAVTPP